ncbi:MAG TPA: hypothetical protein VLU25_13150 [Acidobacteriota bacterium]|nr:hypothetical protein [Acidobacteriota bacterium]
MVDPLYLPITDAQEARAMLDELPMALEPNRFVEFVMGFPRRYLVNTPRVDIVKHYLLMQSRGARPLISSLNREAGRWKLSVITRDRSCLFSNVAGSLSCFGANISSAEAFANANSVVLDTFQFIDRETVFASNKKVQEFQAFLESVVEGEVSLSERFQERIDQVQIDEDRPLRICLDDGSHPSATCLSIDFPDHFGHLYLVGRTISEAGVDIDMAYVKIEGRDVHDQFYLTRRGEKLSDGLQQDLERRLIDLGHRFRRPAPAKALA